MTLKKTVLMTLLAVVGVVVASNQEPDVVVRETPFQDVAQAAEAVFDSGAGDAAVVGRPLFAHPDWPHIIRSGINFRSCLLVLGFYSIVLLKFILFL